MSSTRYRTYCNQLYRHTLAMSIMIKKWNRIYKLRIKYMENVLKIYYSKWYIARNFPQNTTPSLQIHFWMSFYVFMRRIKNIVNEAAQCHPTKIRLGKTLKCVSIHLICQIWQLLAFPQCQQKVNVLQRFWTLRQPGQCN